MRGLRGRTRRTRGLAGIHLSSFGGEEIAAAHIGQDLRRGNVRDHHRAIVEDRRRIGRRSVAGSAGPFPEGRHRGWCGVRRPRGLPVRNGPQDGGRCPERRRSEHRGAGLWPRRIPRAKCNPLRACVRARSPSGRGPSRDDAQGTGRWGLWEVRPGARPRRGSVLRRVCPK